MQNPSFDVSSLARRPLRRLFTCLAAIFALAALTASSASAQQAQWIDGNIQYTYGTSCIPMVGNVYEKQVGAYTGYWGKTDGSYPKVGDRYFGHVYYLPTGLGCGMGAHGVQVEIVLPDNTELAINPSSTDPYDKIQCLGTNTQGQTSNLTDKPWQHPTNPTIKGVYCRSVQVSQGANGTILSFALVGRGQGFEIIFPLRSRKELKGWASGDASKMIATVHEGAITTKAFPDQSVFVGDRPLQMDCPELGPTTTEAITDTTARSKSSICHWYRQGNAQFEIREGTSGQFVPQAAGQPVAVDGNFQGYHLHQNWQGLKPGTEYQTRLKFTDANGIVQLGPVKKFKTTGNPPANGGGGIPQPGNGGSDGAGNGGSNGGNTGGPGNGGGDDGKIPPKTNGPKTPGPKVPVVPKPPRDVLAPSLSAVVAKAKGVLKKGLKVTATCSEACAANAQLKVDKKTARKLKIGNKAVVIGTGSGLSSKPGRFGITVKLNGKGRKAFKRAKSVKASVTVTGADPAGNAAPATTKKVTLKR